MSLYELQSLFEMSDPIKENNLLGRRNSLIERLPSISENQPLVSNLFNELTTSYQPRIFDELPLHSQNQMSSSTSVTCTSLPSNITDLTALLSQLKLHMNNTFPQEDDHLVDNKRQFRLNRSVSEPFHHSLGPTIQPPHGVTTQLSTSVIDSSPTSNTSSSYCRYKTELCRPFEENGSCKYGEKCQFAHGRHELRSLARHPKYKTDLCKTYHTTGLCPYGPRCHFIHNDEERHLNLINRLILEHQRQQAILDQQNNRILRQKQLIAAAASAQKLNSQSTGISRQMSVDTGISSVDQLSALLNLQSTLSALQSNQNQLQQNWQASQFSPIVQSSKSLHQQLRQMSCGGSINSSSESPSSSITESPSPSPTMIEDQMSVNNMPSFRTVLETLLKINQTTGFN